ncbi:MAG: T9SS type A sorting domain-containing protein [Bacteroidota bacterium]|jgi:hypothetical protein
MKKLFTLFSIVLLLNASAQSYSGPESVEYDFANSRWLIGNKNNGTVIARDMNGNFTPFVSGMTSGPYGIEILGNTLYCCYGGGKIRGFDLTTGTQVFNVNLNATFLNGICSDGLNNLFVTDFSAKNIYRVNTTTGAFNLYVTGLTKSPNGIIYDGTNQRLVFVNWGTNAPIQQVALSDSSVTTLLTTTLSNLDGIASDNYGNYYVSTWGNNSIRKFSNNFTTGPSTVVTGLSSPADLFYNKQTDTLAIPNSGTLNNVVWVGFGSTLSSDINQINEHDFTTFPVPGVGGEVNISSKISYKSIKVFSLTGQEVYSSQIEKNISGTNIKLNLSPGIYSVELLSEAGKTSGKITIAD